MSFKGTLKRKNRKANEKISSTTKRNNIDRKPHNNAGQAQILTINNIDYPVHLSDGDLANDSRLNQFNNKDAEIEGVFVGPLLIISSIKKDS